MPYGSITLVLLSLFARTILGASAPDYVTKYAPLVWLDVNEPYFPGDIGGYLTHVRAELNFTPIASSSTKLSLSRLASLNSAGKCSVQNAGDCDVYLTSRDNITKDPDWTHGQIPDANGKTDGAVSSAIITVDRGSGVLDAFYFYWYAYNLGQKVLGRIAGNHLGDWEHSMARFKNGVPQSYWLSIHDSGQAYTYKALQKNGSRPVFYSGLGGHPTYPTPGNHTRNLGIVTLNDTTSAGTLWDPTKNAYWFSFKPTTGNNGTFTALSPTSSAPISWLYFAGRWGDKQYPNNDPRQFSFAGLSYTYTDGPTGPIDKDLERKEVCPDRVDPCSTSTKLPGISGNVKPKKTVKLSFTTTSKSTTTTKGTAAGGSGAGANAASRTSSADSSGTTTGAAAAMHAGLGKNLMMAAGLYQMLGYLV